MFKKWLIKQVKFSGYAYGYEGEIDGRRVVVYVKQTRALTLDWFAKDALEWATEEGIADVYGWDITEPESVHGGFYRLLKNGSYEVIQDECVWQMIRDFVALCEQQAA